MYVQLVCLECTVSVSLSQLAGNFVKNTRKPAMTVILDDIKVSMSADPVSAVFSLSLFLSLCVCVCV